MRAHHIYLKKQKITAGHAEPYCSHVQHQCWTTQAQVLELCRLEGRWRRGAMCPLVSWGGWGLAKIGWKHPCCFSALNEQIKDQYDKVKDNLSPMHSSIFALGPGALCSGCPVAHPNSITLTQRNRPLYTTTTVFVLLCTVSCKELGSQNFMRFFYGQQ